MVISYSGEAFWNGKKRQVSVQLHDGTSLVVLGNVADGNAIYVELERTNLILGEYKQLSGSVRAICYQDKSKPDEVLYKNTPEMCGWYAQRRPGGPLFCLSFEAPPILCGVHTGRHWPYPDGCNKCEIPIVRGFSPENMDRPNYCLRCTLEIEKENT
jgi:hypothetical protein